MIRRTIILFSTACAVAGAAMADGLVSTDELTVAAQWMNQVFAKSASAAVPAGLVVLANHDQVTKNGRGGKPMMIVDKPYNRGIYCHAISKIVVNLPSPGKTFTAVAGVDSNDQTKPGRGSVIFSVNVGDKQAFKSAVMREGMAGVPGSVDLGGAPSFTLDVGDAGDGISSDQSDWADAKVELADGKELWLADLPFTEQKNDLPFSFIYGDKASSELLKDWKREESEKKTDSRIERTIAWTDAETGLKVCCVVVAYRNFPTVEWTLYFKNISAKETPILSRVQALDIWLSRRAQGEFLLHHHVGSVANSDDYRPLQTVLGAGNNLQLASSGGRGSDGVWPYFNLDWGGEGMIAAIGWPGQWAATFARNEGTGLHLQAGQEATHFKLLPGEEVRSPLIALQFWRGGDWIRSQNIWRRWMLAHNLPRLNGELPSPLMPAGSSNQMNEMQNATEENQKQFIDGYLSNGVRIDFWWMDAGWYVFRDGWWNVGTWEPDKKRFPNGLRAVSDHAHAKGVKTLVWFEPERVTPGTWLYENHPEWLLGRDGDQKLFNLGNPDARDWIVEHVSKVMKEEGIDIYRQDFNFPPLGYWRANDAADRQGITEIKHVTGYLAFWDELRRRNPGLLIDTCASGGRRNDLETLRRSVPLHKSDMEYPNLTAKQTQLYGLAFWAPYFGAPVYPADRVEVYGFRSGIAPMTGLGYDSRRSDLDYALMRKLVAEWKEVTPNFFGDYYPLTTWSSEPQVWMAWQFDRPELGVGVVEAFRRPESPYETARLKLRELDAGASYELKNFDDPEPIKIPGRELMETGLPVTLKNRPAAAIITYKKVK